MVRIARVTAGFGLIAAGGAMLVLPGPGILTMAAGLGLIAPEFDWADRLKTNITEKTNRLRGKS